MQFNRSNRSLSPLAFVLMMAALFLTVSGQASAQTLMPSQRQVVTNLTNASGDIKGQLALGTRYSAALSTAANSGTIVEPTAYQTATISEAQRTTYNSAALAFNSTNFNGSRQYFETQASNNLANMRASIADLAAATVDLQKVVSVNQMVSAITDVPTARVTQTAILNAGLGSEVSAQQVSAYNSSLANVNSYASQAALFMRAAQNVTLTSNVDTFVNAYAKDLNYVQTTAAYANTSITLAWADGLQITQEGMLNNFTQGASSFYTSVVNPFTEQ
jgi:hypothetical protein